MSNMSNMFNIFNTLLKVDDFVADKIASQEGLQTLQSKVKDLEENELTELLNKTNNSYESIGNVMPDSRLRLTLGKQVCIILSEERLRAVRKSSMDDEQKEKFDKLASRIKTLGSETDDIEKVEQLINILNTELASIGEASSGDISHGALVPPYMEYINPKKIGAM